MQNHTYLTTRDAKVAEENRQAGFDVQAAKRTSGLGFTSLDHFLLYADGDDLWPFAFIDRRPIDLFASLTLELSDEDDCRWLSLQEYLECLASERSIPLAPVK